MTPRELFVSAFMLGAPAVYVALAVGYYRADPVLAELAPREFRESTTWKFDAMVTLFVAALLFPSAGYWGEWTYDALRVLVPILIEPAVTAVEAGSQVIAALAVWGVFFTPRPTGHDLLY